MIYNLKFLPTAFKEWEKLGDTIRQQLKKKLKERLKNPRIVKDLLRGLKDHYKIKLRASRYRLVYRVFDDSVCIVVIAIAKRDKGLVYALTEERHSLKSTPFLIEE